MSDIRKIQTGNNQYTLHARVSDKLASVAKYKNASLNNYPWHRIATSGVLTTKVFDDKSVFLFLAEHYNDGRQGTIWISLRRNNTGNSLAVAKWISRSGFNIDDIQLGLNSTPGDTCLDIFVRAITPWTGGNVMMLSGGSRGADVDCYEFVNSSEDTNTTTTDKKTSVEVYKTIEEAATQLHGKAYTSIIKPTDSGTVANAGYAEKIGTNESHQQIGSSTKPVFVDANGKILACSRDIPAVDTAMSATSTNPVLNKAVFDALKLKADTAALSAYQPKYNADYVAASDFDYSELPADAEVIDLNGYTMTISVDNIFIIQECHNGHIDINSSQVELTGVFYNVRVHFNTDFEYCKINNSTFKGCTVNNILIDDYDGDSSFRNCSINSCVIKNIGRVSFSNLQECTFATSLGNYAKIENSIIDDVIYNRAVIKDGKPTEAGFELNIANPIIPGNAPSCEAVKDALQLKADKTQLNGLATKTELNSKADASALNNYVTTATANTTYAKKSDITNIYKFKGTKTNYADLPTTNRVTGDVWNITNADAEHGIKAGDNVAWNDTAWDNLSGTVDLSNYLQKGGKQTTTSTADGGSNIYTFKDGSTITVKNGSKGSTGAAATWFSGGAVTGTSTTAKTFTVSGSKAGDMYLNTGTSNVYKATAANLWVYLCNIKGPQGTPGNNGTTPTIKAAAGGNIGAVGTPSVTANTSGTTTTFTFNNLKGQKGDTGATVTWHTGTAVTGTAATVAGAKTGDMYLNTKTYNVYKSTGTNKWAGVCNIKGANGTTPTIKAAAGGNINSVGTPTVSATTSGAITTFTFNNLKGLKGETGATITWHSGTAVPNAGVHAVTNAKVGDMYLNTHTCDVFKAANAVQASFNWVLVCNIKGAKGDAADIPKLAKGVAGIVPGTTNDSLNASRWLNGGDNGTGMWKPLPTAGGGTSGAVRTCKDYTGSINRDDIKGYAHGTTPPTLLPITSGASDYRGVESDGSGRLFVNVPAYEKNINRAQNTVLAAPTTGTGTATFRKLTTSDIPWGDKLKVVTESQFNSTTPTAGVFYFVLEE